MVFIVNKFWFYLFFEIKFRKKYKHIIHKIYQEQGLDKAYNKYLKRVRNRKKLYEKLRKVGR